MNKLFKHNLYTLIAAVTLGVFSFGFAPAAMALAIYDADASLSLTLTNVSDGSGQVSTGWSVEAEGKGDTLLYQFGLAQAFGSTSVVNQVLGIDDTITQTSSAYGTATDGFSWTDALTDLDLFVDNDSGEDLTFSFAYLITASAMASGEEAMAYAGVNIWHDFDLDILFEAEADSVFGPESFSDTVNGTFELMLQSGNSTMISAFVDTDGAAYAAVPEPAVTWLFGIGLLGLLGIARNRQAV